MAIGIRGELEPNYAARAFHSMVFVFFRLNDCVRSKPHVTKYADMVDVFVDILLSRYKNAGLKRR